MSIEFTQFLRPNGRRKQTSIEVAPDVQHLADELVAAGYRFEIEVLRTEHVSMDCSRPGDDLPLAMEVVPNGPAVPAAVAKLVHDAHRLHKLRN